MAQVTSHPTLHFRSQPATVTLETLTQSQPYKSIKAELRLVASADSVLQVARNKSDWPLEGCSQNMEWHAFWCARE